MPKHSPLPIAVPYDKFMAWSDAESGVDIAIDQAQFLAGLLNVLQWQADAGAADHPLTQFVQAAVLLARESLDALRVGADQTRDNLPALRPAEGEVAR